MKPWAITLALALLAPGTQAAPPARDLTVELRQIEEGGAGHVVGTQPTAALLAPQQIQVRNGAKATFTLGQTIPVQWVQSATVRNDAFTASGGAPAGSQGPSVSASSRGGGVQQAVTWLDASQSLTVKPSWPGGKQAATVDVEVQSSNVEARTGGAELPAQSRSQLVTTVSAPLGQWVTIASTGGGAQRGVYGSEAALQTRRLIQLRVLAP